MSGANVNPNKDDSDFDQYRKRMMLAYKFRPNPMVNMNFYLYISTFNNINCSYMPLKRITQGDRIIDVWDDHNEK